MPDALLETASLHTYYGTSHVLRGIDFKIQPGETVALMGRNGMGKSTLLKTMLGLVRPRLGHVRIWGKDMTRASTHKIVRQGIGYVREQQMLAIGRALMTNPELLILDEATEGLAPAIAKEIWRIVREIRDTGIATIIVDKNFAALLPLVDRSVILVKGEVVYDGPAKDLNAQRDFVHQHLGV
jgi:branched-chain amino acid transport system ATP-binding protein